LRRNAPQAGLTLEYLSAANNWKALRISGRRYSIDERTKLLSAGREVWTLSADGLVRLSWASDLLVLDLNSFHIAALPVSRGKACAVDRIEPADGSGIALAAAPPLDPKRIFLRCAYETVFSSAAVGAADDGGFAILPSGTDPFQSRSVLETQDGALRWKVERPVNSAGRLSVEWRGQPTPLTAGRFQADALRSVASFQEGTLEIVSEQGWASAPERAPTLASSARPAGRPEAVNVRAVARDFDDSGKPFLCLSVSSPARNVGATDGGAQAAYRADGSFEPGVDCGRHDAHEGNWRYRARLQQPTPRVGAQRLSIRGFDANKTAFDRPFVDGRFGDMVAVAGPILGKVGASYRILVPTTAGTTSLGAKGELIDAPVHRSPSAKLWTLMSVDDDTVRVVTSSRIEFLDGRPADGCAAAPKMLEALSERTRDPRSADIKVLSVNHTARGRLELVVRAGSERLMLEQACSGEALPGQWRTIVDTAGRPRLKALGDRWPWGPEINFSWRNDRLTAMRAGTAEANAALLVPNAKAPLRLLHTASGVILVTEGELYRVDLDRTLSSLAQ